VGEMSFKGDLRRVCVHARSLRFCWSSGPLLRSQKQTLVTRPIWL